jgi:DNA repair protein RadC
MTSLAIRHLPAPERPRERLKNHGPRALTSAELIAILLGAGSEGRSALDVSRELLASCQGSLRKLASRPLPALTAVRGIGLARAVTIHAALELGHRMSSEETIEGVQLKSARDVYQIYAPRIQDLPIEEFHVATLDSQHRLQSDVLVTRGLLNAALAHPREVFRHAIAENAYAIMLVHNHPSGDPTPSEHDKFITSQLHLSGQILGIPVLDHIIIGRGRFASFAELGILI